MSMDVGGPGGEHGPDWYCAAPKKDGRLCENRAGKGTGHVGIGKCSNHGGSTPTHEQHGARWKARGELARLGVAPREVEPAQALLELVYEAAGNVEFYRDLVAKLQATPDLARFVPGEDGDGGRWEESMTAVYGPTRHQSGIPTGEAKRHILVQLYDDERDRLKDYATAVIKCGLAARQVELAELQAALVARVVMGLLDDPELGLSREQRTVGRTVAGRHLRVLGAGTAA